MCSGCKSEAVNEGTIRFRSGGCGDINFDLMPVLGVYHSHWSPKSNRLLSSKIAIILCAFLNHWTILGGVIPSAKLAENFKLHVWSMKVT